MVRCKWCLLMLVLLVPFRLGLKMQNKHLEKDKSDDDPDDNDTDNERIDDEDRDDDADDDDDDGAARGKTEHAPPTLRRTSPAFDFSLGVSSTSTVARSIAPLAVRTTKKKPLECYVCVYKMGIALQACLDPWKHRVHTIVCPSLTDRCYTWIVSKDNRYEAVTRGCKGGCVSSPETMCCEFSHCNNQPLTLPSMAPQVLQKRDDSPPSKNIAKKNTPPTVMFFVTILLLLQTVVRVPIT